MLKSPPVILKGRNEMRKLWIIVLALVVLVGCSKAAEAMEEFTYDKSKVVIGTSFSVEDKDIDEAIIGSAQIGGLGLDVTTTLTDFEVSTQLLKLGYEINESVTPYILVGRANIDMQQKLDGSLQVGNNGIGGTIMQTDMDEDGLAYGVGIGGDLAQYKGIVMGYDAKWIGTSIDSQGDNLSILPGYTNIKLNNDVDVDYTELDLALMFSKVFEFKDEEGNNKMKFLESVAPMVGYRYSYSTVNVENKTSAGPLSMESETNYRSHNHDALVGLDAKINDNVAVNIAAIVGDNTGIMAGTSYRF
jgi:hypothetical protein